MESGNNGMNQAARVTEAPDDSGEMGNGTNGMNQMTWVTEASDDPKAMPCG